MAGGKHTRRNHPGIGPVLEWQRAAQRQNMIISIQIFCPCNVQHALGNIKRLHFRVTQCLQPLSDQPRSSPRIQHRSGSPHHMPRKQGHASLRMLITCLSHLTIVTFGPFIVECCHIFSILGAIDRSQISSVFRHALPISVFPMLACKP